MRRGSAHTFRILRHTRVSRFLRKILLHPGTKNETIQLDMVKYSRLPFILCKQRRIIPKRPEHDWGIYGMKLVAAAGLNSFLEGLDNQPYVYNNNWITGSISGSVYLSSEAQYYCNYYGIYPSYYQSSSRALPTSILSDLPFERSNLHF